RLEAEYADRLDKWADLPTARGKEMAKARFVHMDARLDELRRQRQDASQLVERQHRELNDLAPAVKDARRGMTAEAGEQRYRQRAEALRAIIQRIECNFVATGATGGGWGKKNSKLVSVTIYPVAGDSREFPAESKGTLQSCNALALFYRKAAPAEATHGWL